MIKKWVSWFIALAMILSLAGCGAVPSDSGAKPADTKNEAEEQAPADEGEEAAPEDSGEEEAAGISHDEEYDIEMFNTYANYMGDTTGWYAKILLDKFNMKMNIIAPNVAGTGDQLYQTRSAAGNLGDIIVQTKARMIDCYTAGLLGSMSPYLPNCPNLQKLSFAYEAFRESMGTDEVYAIPGRVSNNDASKAAGRGVNVEAGTFLRWDAYLAAGAPKLATLDDLVKLLYQMQDDNPTTDAGEKVYAFSLFGDWDGSTVRGSREMMYLYGYSGAQGYYWMTPDGSDVINLIDDDSLYYQWLKIYNKAYRDGYLDPDSATQPWDTINTKAKDGRVLFSWWTFLGRNIYSTGYDPSTYGFGYVPTDDSLICNAGYNKYGAEGNAFAIGSGAKYPDRLMEFLDFYASEEGLLYNSGLIEGISYEMVDGHPVLTEFGLDTSSDKVAPDELGGGKWDDGTCKINYPLVHSDDPNSLLGGEPTTTSLWKSTLENGRNDYTNKWEELYGVYSPLEYLESRNQLTVAPGIDYASPADPSDISTIRAQLSTLTKNAGWQMIYAESDEEFEKIWADMKAQLDDFGWQELCDYDMAIVNDMIAARKKVLGE